MHHHVPGAVGRGADSAATDARWLAGSRQTGNRAAGQAPRSGFMAWNAKRSRSEAGNHWKQIKEVTAPLFCIWILENQSPNIDSCIQM